MSRIVNRHHEFLPGVEIQRAVYPKVATAAALPILTADHVGTIYTTIDTGLDWKLKESDGVDAKWRPIADFPDANGDVWEYQADTNGVLHRWLAKQPPVTFTTPNGSDILSTPIQVPQTDFQYRIAKRIPAAFTSAAGLGGQYVTGGDLRGWAGRINLDGTVTFYASINGSSGGTNAGTLTTTRTIYDFGAVADDLAIIELRFIYNGAGVGATIQVMIDIPPQSVDPDYEPSLSLMETLTGLRTNPGNVPIDALPNLLVPVHIGSRWRTDAVAGSGRESTSATVESASLTVGSTVVASWPSPVAAEAWDVSTVTPLTSPPAVPAKADRLGELADLRPEQFGAIGDGVADDSQAFADALARAAVFGGGKLILSSRATYRIAGQSLEWARESGQLFFEGNNAEMVNDTTGHLFRVSSASSAGDLPYITLDSVFATGGATGTDCIVLSDTSGTRIIDCRFREHPNGALLAVENHEEWCEQTTVIGTKFQAGKQAIDFRTPAFFGLGEGGTVSFARTKVVGCGVSGGVAGEPLIWCRGGVYGGEFRGIGGNLTSGANVFRLDSTIENLAMGGTEIAGLDYEFGGTASSFIEAVGAFGFGGAAPPKLRGFTEHGGEQFFAVGTDPELFATHDFYGNDITLNGDHVAPFYAREVYSGRNITAGRTSILSAGLGTNAGTTVEAPTPRFGSWFNALVDGDGSQNSADITGPGMTGVNGLIVSDGLPVQFIAVGDGGGGFEWKRLPRLGDGNAAAGSFTDPTATLLSFNINHGLTLTNQLPSVTFFSDENGKVLPDEVYVDADNLTATFTVPLTATETVNWRAT